MKKLIFCIIILILLVSIMYGYGWPTGEERTITGTFGELRGNDCDRFHTGIDISGVRWDELEIVDRGVYKIDGYIPPDYIADGNPIKDSIIILGKNYIRIGDLRYLHIIPSQGFLDSFNINDTIQLGEVIGSIEYNHLHLDECYDVEIFGTGDTLRLYNNPLRPEGLESYIDTTFPVARDGSLIYYRNGKEIDTNILWGDIDILGVAKDIQDDYAGRVNIYKQQIYLRKKGNETLINEYKFNEEYSDTGSFSVHYGVGLILDSTDKFATDEYYGYWLTNKFVNTLHNGEDRYWRTNLYWNGKWDDSITNSNRTAKYHDGQYFLDFQVYGISDNTRDTLILNGGDTINWRGATRDTIILDNFAPAYSSNYSLFNTFIFDTTTNQEYLLGSYNISQYDEFRVYDNMKLNLVLGPTESINENIVSGAFYDTNGNINNRNFVFLGYEFTDSRVEATYLFKTRGDSNVISTFYLLNSEDEAGNVFNKHFNSESARDGNGEFINRNPSIAIPTITIIYGANTPIDTFPLFPDSIPDDPWPQEPEDTLPIYPDTVEIHWTDFESGSPTGQLDYREGSLLVKAYYISNCGISSGQLTINGDAAAGIISLESTDSLSNMNLYSISRSVDVHGGKTYTIESVANNGYYNTYGDWTFSIEEPESYFIKGVPQGNVESGEYTPMGIFFSEAPVNSAYMKINDGSASSSCMVQATKGGYLITVTSSEISISDEVDFEAGINPSGCDFPTIGSWKANVSDDVMIVGLGAYTEKIDMYGYGDYLSGFLYTFNMQDDWNAWIQYSNIKRYELYGRLDHHSIYTPTSNYTIKGLDYASGIGKEGNDLDEVNLYAAKLNNAAQVIGKYKGKCIYLNSGIGGDEQQLASKSQSINLTQATEANYFWILRNDRLIKLDSLGDTLLIRCKSGLDNGTSEKDTCLNHASDVLEYGNILYIADKNNNYIKAFDRETGDFIYKFGGYDSLYTDSYFVLPEMLFTADSALFVIDNQRTRIKQYSMNGIFIGVDTMETFSEWSSDKAIMLNKEYSSDIDTIRTGDILYGKINDISLKEYYLSFIDSQGNETIWNNSKREIYYPQQMGFYFYDLPIKRNKYYKMYLNGVKSDTILRDSLNIYHTFHNPELIIDSSDMDFGSISISDIPKESNLETIYLNLLFSKDSLFSNEDSVYIGWSASPDFYQNSISTTRENIDMDSLSAGNWYFKARYYKYYDGYAVYGEFGPIQSIYMPNDWSIPEITLHKPDTYLEYGRQNIPVIWEGKDYEGIKYYKMYFDTGQGYIYSDSLSASDMLLNLHISNPFDSLRVKITAYDGTNEGIVESKWLHTIKGITFDIDIPEAEIIEDNDSSCVAFSSSNELFLWNLEDKQNAYGRINCFDVWNNYIAFNNDTGINVIDIEDRINYYLPERNIIDISIDERNLYYAQIDTLTSLLNIYETNLLNISEQNLVFTDTSTLNDSTIPSIDAFNKNNKQYLVYKSAGNNIVLFENGDVIQSLKLEDGLQNVKVSNYWYRLDLLYNLNDTEYLQYSILPGLAPVASFELPGTNSLSMLNYIYSNRDNSIVRNHFNSEGIGEEKIINGKGQLLDINFRRQYLYGIPEVLIAEDTAGLKKFKIIKDTLKELYVSDSIATAYNNADHTLNIGETIYNAISSDNNMLVFSSDSVNISSLNNQSSITFSCSNAAPVLIANDSLMYAIWTYCGDVYMSKYTQDFWNNPVKLLDAVNPDSVQMGEELSSYNSLSGKIIGDSVCFTGIYHQKSTDPNASAKTHWLYGSFHMQTPNNVNTVYYDSLQTSPNIIPKSPIIENNNEGDKYIVYEKYTPNICKNMLKILYPLYDTSGIVSGYQIEDIDVGSHPDVYFNGWIFYISYYNEETNTLKVSEIYKNGYIIDIYEVDDLNNVCFPNIFNELLFYEQQNDIYYARYEEREQKYKIIDKCLNNPYSKSHFPSFNRKEDIFRIYYNGIWTEGNRPSYIEQKNYELRNIQLRILSYNAGTSFDAFILKRDTVYSFESSDPYRTIDYGNKLLEYEIDGMENDKYIIETVYYYEDIDSIDNSLIETEISTPDDKHWDNHIRIMKTINEMNNKEQIEFGECAKLSVKLKNRS